MRKTGRTEGNVGPHKRVARIVAVLAVALCAAAYGDALTLTWNGGASGNFSDASWSGGVEGHASPQNGDTLVFATGGTFANDITGLSVANLEFRSADAVTLSGSQIAVANGGSITNTGAGAVSFNASLSLGTAATPAIRIGVANGSTVTFNACISGAANLVYCDNGTVNLNVDNDYTGKTTINKGLIHVYANNAFGTTAGNTEIKLPDRNPSVMNHVYFHGVTMSENFSNNTKTQTGGIVFPAGTTNVFNGTVEDAAADMYTYNNNAKIVYNGKATFPNPSATIKESNVVEFNGDGSGFGWDYFGGPGVISYGGQCYVKDSSHWVRINTNQKRYFNCENAMYYNNVPASLRVYGTGGLADMCGYDQTFWYISCDSGNASTVITSAAPSTVHLTLGPTNASWNAAGSRVSYATIKGPISLSFEGPMPFSLGGNCSAATGSLSLTNASDITFIAGFEWGGNSLTVAGGSSLTINAVTLPEDLQLAILDEPGADGVTVPYSRMVLNGNLTLASLSLNGVTLAAGKTYGSSASGADVVDDDRFSGMGVLAVGSAHIAATEGTWTGGGNTDRADEAANWSIDPEVPNLASGLFTATFAEGGEQALLMGSANLAGVVFDGPSTGADTAFRLGADTSAPDATLTVGGGGITVHDTADGFNHTYTVDVPLVLNAAVPTWTVAGEKSTLVFAKPISSTLASMNFLYAGAGTFKLLATNSVPGSRTINAGNLYATTGALGPADTAVTITPSGNQVYMHFDGGTFDQNITITRRTSPAFRMYYESFKTNVFTRTVTQSESYGCEHLYQASNTTVFAEGYSMSGWYLNNTLYPGAKLVYQKKLKVTSTAAVGFLMYTSSKLKTNDYAQIVFRESGGTATNGWRFVDGVYVRFEAPFACVTNGWPSPLTFQLRYASSPNSPIMDLNGYDQSFGDLRQQGYSATTYPPSTNGLIFSERPATMYVWQNKLSSDEGDNVVLGGWRARYQGAVSLEKSGPKHLILGGYSTTTGRLTVVEGTLSFAGNGAWPNASEIVVKGGTLEIDAASRVKDKAIYRLSPDGKLDLAAGVTVRANDLYVPNGLGGWTLASAGRYTAANAPSLISGAGELIVMRHGMIVTFR